RREYFTQKGCAPHCTISCAQQIAMVDNWRDPQTLPSTLPQSDRLVQLQTSMREGR
ncbi:MAG: hypothetical protein HYS38_07655, partial [Acidobacteria bacterium]|nr:hypothetical protein [Acidobacteriota bacterium]